MEKLKEDLKRNGPCICGSGKKYKYCCIDKVISIPVDFLENKNQSSGSEGIASQINQRFVDMISAQNFNSFDQVKEFMKETSNQHNDSNESDFLGMSPNQMQRIIYFPFEFQTEVFSFNENNLEGLCEVPILNEALYLLNRIHEAGKLKSTQKGNFQKALVLEFYDKFNRRNIDIFRPNNEDDYMELKCLKHYLTLSGNIKKTGNYFSLTKKGASRLSQPAELYKELFLTIANKFNWAYWDRYQEFPLIQNTLIFNLYLLSKKANDWVHEKELGKFYFKAFPALANECEMSTIIKPVSEVSGCFTVRFLKNFAVALGLLESKKVDEKAKWSRYYYFKTTTFFKDNIKFHL